MATSPSASSLPPSARIIQGGMGVGVSTWKLARAVATAGEIGVVSGTAIDTVVVRELQQGDPHGRRRALRAYPDAEIVDDLLDQFFVEGGVAPGTPYRLLPIHKFRPTVRSQRILSAAAFSEVYLAKEGHDGYVGINLLCELKRNTLAALYGAMLAGVDAVMMGAGIPLEEAKQLPLLARGEPARLRLEVDTTQAPADTGPFYYDLDPADLVPEPQPLPQPDFFPIIASDVLARVLHAKLADGLVTGWIIEGPTAGGHNAPPRNKQYDAAHNPVYDERDVANLDRITALGYPFFLAGGYGTPERLREALALGATGIQIGSLFSLADESGYPAAHKARLIRAIHQERLRVRTDGRISPTGFPFKVLELPDTNGEPATYAQRRRLCDLGYLQHAYVDANGKLLTRCPAEPIAAYARKGGDPADAERRGCLCNGLMANIGLGQIQKWGAERPLFTGGDDLAALPLGSIDHPSYTAQDVIDYLLGRHGATA